MRASLAATVLALVAAPLSAQRPQTRQGFWIGFGVGYGPANITCRDCGDTDARSNFTSFLRLGGTLNPQVLLGGDLSGWSRTENGVTASFGTATASVHYYPRAAGGFFVSGGAGFSAYRVAGDLELTGAGVGLAAGVGYDVRVGTKISLTPIAEFIFGSVGDLDFNGTTIDAELKASVFHIALGVTFH